MDELDRIRREARRASKGRPRATTKRVNLRRMNEGIPAAAVYLCMVNEDWYALNIEGHPALEEELEVYAEDLAGFVADADEPPLSSPPRGTSPALSFHQSSDER